MTPSFSTLTREPARATKKLATIVERMPKVRVDVALSAAKLRLTFGKSVLDIEIDRDSTSSDAPGQRSGLGSIVPPDAKVADAILAAIARAVSAEVPERPHTPGLRMPLAVSLSGLHAATGKKASLVWITIELEDGALGHRWHLLVGPGKDRGYLHIELPRGAANRDKLLVDFAGTFRDGQPPRSTPLTDVRCASATPWLETSPLLVPEGLDMAFARWGGATLFATRSEGETTLLLRCDGPQGFVELTRIDRLDVAIYPSPTGAHVLIEARGAEPMRELLDVASGLRTLLVEKHELFTFGDTAGGALWSADGVRVALGGKVSRAGLRAAVLVYDVKLGVFVDATPIEGTFFASHWEGTALCLGGGSFNGVAFRWEPGRSEPRADIVLGRASPGGRFAIVTEEERARVLDRRTGAFTGSLPPSDGRYAYDDLWVTDEDDPRVFDLGTDRFVYLAPSGQILALNVAPAAPRAVYNDGTRWLWGEARDSATAKLAIEHAPPTIARRALAARRAGRIEDASILVAEDPNGAAKRALSQLEKRLRAESALEAGNAWIARDVEGALARYEAAVQDAPELYEALHSCERALGQLGRTEEQREVAGFLCARFPISSAAWLLRSVTLQNAEDLPGALAAIERALLLDAEGSDLGPRRAKTADILHQRACVHLLDGRKKEALDDVRTVLSREPSAKAQLLADPHLAALRRHPLLRG